MILTYKIKHSRDFHKELELARKVANYAIKYKSLSTADVKHIGLKSIIANQILRKYAKNRTIKSVKSIKLTIPNQGIKYIDGKIEIPCLRLTLPVFFDNGFTKINQIEIGEIYAYISCSYQEPPIYQPEQVIGVDRNTNKHILVACNLNTGKVLKLGKICQHIHNKYKHIRKTLQKKAKFSLLKKIKHRERNKIKDINHKVSKKLVKTAQNNKAVLVLENLKDIRKTAKTRKSQRYALNSWSFYQLGSMIEYKARKFGVPIFYIEPQYTSQRCSRCGHIERNNRLSKKFHCQNCGVVENADVNAGFNIGHLYQAGISQFSKDRDLLKGVIDAPKEALLLT